MNNYNDANTDDANIPIANIYYMMAYAYKELTENDIAYIDPEKFKNIHSLMAEIIIIRTTYQLKKGLLRNYEGQAEELAAVRGKINISETINRGTMVRSKLFCEFDEYVSDTLMNRILKSVMLLLLRSDIRPEQADRLVSLLRFFSEIGRTDLHNISWDRLSFSRHNSDYRFLMTICRMIVENMLLSTDEGDVLVSNFNDTERLSHLYEKFLLGYFKRHWGDKISVDSPTVKWDCNDKNNILPEMRTDIVLHDKKSSRKLIIDAKFYKNNIQEYHGNESLISGHIYQIFAYVTNESANFNGSVSGMMLYAQTGDSKLTEDGTSYNINGHKYTFRSLDLSVDFEKISESLNMIAENFINED